MKYNSEVLLTASLPERYWDKHYLGINAAQRQRIVEKLYPKYILDKYELCPHVLDDIIDAIGLYLHSDIETSLRCGQDLFIKALAVLDRRCRKRCFQKYANIRVSGYLDWLKRIFQTRFDAEEIPYSQDYITSCQRFI